METKWIILIIVALVIVAAGIIAFILYRKKKQYDFVFKMMEQKKKQEALAKQKQAFVEKRAELSSNEATQIVACLGGIANIVQIEQCAIRIRVAVKDNGQVDQKALKKAGVSGVIKTAKGLQLIVGDRAEQIATEITKLLES
jgi:PTS system, glucose-like IIB component